MGIVCNPCENPKSDFPENKIILLNGNELTCHPKPVQPEIIQKDNLKLDTTGQYFSIGKKKDVICQEDKNGLDIAKMFFLDHAFYFLKNADRIFKDSRMFLAPVQVPNGIAYTGTSGFGHPTLGIYLEWWMNWQKDIRHDRNGKDALTFQIAGSPLSGRNHCCCVYPDGTTGSITHSPFIDVWSSFMKINRRYNEAKQKYEAYSLQEVYDILVAADESKERKLSLMLKIQTEKYDSLAGMCHELRSKVRDLIMRLHNSELAAFKDEFRRRERAAHSELKSLAVKRTDLRQQWEQGMFTQPQYCQQVNPIRIREQEIEAELTRFKNESVSSLLESGELDIYMINDFLND